MSTEDPTTPEPVEPDQAEPVEPDRTQPQPDAPDDGDE